MTSRSWIPLAAAIALATLSCSDPARLPGQSGVTVRAQAAIRPAGELRIVQAQVAGPITEILVTQDQTVEEGAVIATVDDSHLRTEQTKLRTAIDNAARQLDQLQEQLKAKDRQIVAEQGCFPIVWAKPSTEAVINPGRANGKATVKKRSSGDAPSVAATSIGRRPTARNASCNGCTTNGSE